MANRRQVLPAVNNPGQEQVRALVQEVQSSRVKIFRLLGEPIERMSENIGFEEVGWGRVGWLHTTHTSLSEGVHIWLIDTKYSGTKYLVPLRSLLPQHVFSLTPFKGRKILD